VCRLTSVLDCACGATLPADLAAGTTVIQNSLNDQTIRSTTVLSATSNRLQFLRSISTGATLRDALTAPLTPR